MGLKLKGMTMSQEDALEHLEASTVEAFLEPKLRQEAWDTWCYQLMIHLGKTNHFYASKEVLDCIEASKTLPRPIPMEVTWRFFWSKDHEIRTLKTSLLEMLLLAPEHAYHSFGAIPKNHHSEAIQNLGLEWLEEYRQDLRYVPLKGLLESIFSLPVARHSLDAFKRIEIACAWGAMKPSPKNKLLKSIVSGLGWYKDKKHYWDFLVQQGLFDNMAGLKPQSTFTLEEPEALTAKNHPIIALLETNNPDAIIMDLALKKIVNEQTIGWQDPSSGTNLWHYAAFYKDQPWRKLLPFLNKMAPHLCENQLMYDDTVLNQYKKKRTEFNAQSGDTPMHIALRRRNAEAVDSLLSLKPDPLVKNNDNETPLWALVNTDLTHEMMFEAFIKITKNVETEPHTINRSAFNEIFKTYSKAIDHQHTHNEKGMTPLQALVVKRAPLEIIQWLIHIHPEDIGGASDIQKQCKDILSTDYKEEGVALVEKCELEVILKHKPSMGSEDDDMGLFLLRKERSKSL